MGEGAALFESRILLKAPSPWSGPRIRVGLSSYDRLAVRDALLRYADGRLPTIAALAAELAISASTAQRLLTSPDTIPGIGAALMAACRMRSGANRARAGFTRRHLSLDAAAAIRAARKSGASLTQLARSAGVSRSTICHIIARRTYQPPKFGNAPR